MGNSSYVKFDKPLRGDILCRNCATEIEAIAETRGSFSIKGIRQFTWRHVKSGLDTCTHVYAASPYDEWDATRKLETPIFTGPVNKPETVNKPRPYVDRGGYCHVCGGWHKGECDARNAI